MSKNRRNYYRILHVQPEAPLEIIRASYRTLMGPLRAHPDLGGDHEAAALINEAWAVLGDPEKRRAYDLARAAQGAGRAGATRGAATPTGARADVPRPAGAPSGAAGARESAHAGAAPGWDPARWRDERCCPMCRAPLPATLAADSRCRSCDSPLAPPPRVASPRGAATDAAGPGRRASARVPKQHGATMRVGPRGVALPVRMRDLSLDGVSIWSGDPVGVGRVVRISDPSFDAVANVVSCRRVGAGYSVHARLLTVMFLRASGVFVSTMA